MNYKNIFLALFIILIISTLCISISKPKMHKTVLIYDSKYMVKKDETPDIKDVEIPTVKQETQTVSAQTRLKNNVQKEQTTTPTKAPVVKKEIKTIVNAQPVKKQTTTENKPVVKVQKAPEVKTVEKTEQKQATPPKQTQTQTNITTKPKVLTAEQEEIAWNIWRSNLQNQIMKDVRLPIIPNGIVFKFTFDVDKFGKISNLQTWSITPSYTPYAVQYIAPVIRSYQGRTILNFPEGSIRTTTKVTGGWRIAANTKYSTPQDYNDTEKVVK